MGTNALLRPFYRVFCHCICKRKNSEGKVGSTVFVKLKSPVESNALVEAEIQLVIGSERLVLVKKHQATVAAGVWLAVIEMFKLLQRLCGIESSHMAYA